MKVEHLSDQVTLILGDACEVVPTLGAFDHVFTDPSYEDSIHNAKAKAGQRRFRTDGHADLQALDFASIADIRERITPALVRSCNGWLLVFCTPEGIAPWRDALEAAGARYKRACFWYKPDSAPQFNGQGPGFAVEPFVSAWCGAGYSSWNGGGRRNHFTHQTNSSDRHGVHPTEKPVSLMSEIVNLFSSQGQHILDPFMGSGTTGVAAVRHGRSFTGIEINEVYFDIACRRISDALRRPDIFAAGFEKLKQTKLFEAAE